MLLNNSISINTIGGSYKIPVTLTNVEVVESKDNTYIILTVHNSEAGMDIALFLKKADEVWKFARPVSKFLFDNGYLELPNDSEEAFAKVYEYLYACIGKSTVLITDAKDVVKKELVNNNIVESVKTYVNFTLGEMFTPDQIHAAFAKFKVD